jgi:methylated-DNA-protein-cysteine methyltransferase related protein
MASAFREDIYRIVRTVPPGRVTTYGDVAAVAGSPRAARQVGYAMAALPEGTDVPWHRVINAQGCISRRGDLERPLEQLRRLEDEGVIFDAVDKCDLDGLRWWYPEFQ